MQLRKHFITPLSDGVPGPPGGLSKDYKARFRTVQFNLADASNPDFRSKVLRGGVQPATLLRMAPQDMASEVRPAPKRAVSAAAMRGPCEKPRFRGWSAAGGPWRL